MLACVAHRATTTRVALRNANVALRNANRVQDLPIGVVAALRAALHRACIVLACVAHRATTTRVALRNANRVQTLPIGVVAAL